MLVAGIALYVHVVLQAQVNQGDVVVIRLEEARVLEDSRVSHSIVFGWNQEWPWHIEYDFVVKPMLYLGGGII